MTTRSALSLLNDPDAFATSVFFAAAQILGYDLETLAMDPEALLLELRNAVDRPILAENAQKLLAAQAIYFSDAIYEDLSAFINAANLLANRDPGPPHIFDPADIFECCWLKFEMELIDGGRGEEEMDLTDRNPYLEPTREPPKRVMTFSKEICRYVGAAASTEGAMRPLPQFPEMVIPDVELASPDAAEFAMITDRHRELVEEVTDGIVENATILFSQLQCIRGADKKPLVSAEEGAQIVERLSKLWAPRVDYFGS